MIQVARSHTFALNRSLPKNWHGEREACGESCELSHDAGGLDSVRWYARWECSLCVVEYASRSSLYIDELFPVGTSGNAKLTACYI